MATLEGMAEHCEGCGVKLEIGQIGYCGDCNSEQRADQYRVGIDVEVFDANALFKAAVAHHVKDDSVSEAEARAALTTESGDININACLMMLFDPGVSPDGTSILGSEAESVG